MGKKELSERDICTKFITAALPSAGWDQISQLREEVSFTNGRIIVRGKMVTRGKAKRADYIFTTSRNSPVAVIEAKDNNCHELTDDHDLTDDGYDKKCDIRIPPGFIPHAVRRSIVS